MHFTRYHSLPDILAYPEMKAYLSVFFSEKNLAMFPEEMRRLPLAYVEQVAECPWDAPFSEVTNQLLDAVQTVLDIMERKSRRCVQLWNPEKDWTPECVGQAGRGLASFRILERKKQSARESVFLLTPEFQKAEMENLSAGREKAEAENKYTDSKKPERNLRPAVIICPGGGYESVCFSGEGNPVMRYMEAQGYAAFVLKYRVAPARYPAPQEDLALAVAYVREHAEEYGADPHHIMAMGFSAGGHLCASLGCFYKEIAEALYEEGKDTGTAAALPEPSIFRPDRICLAYPVITFGKECHEGSFQALTGGKEALREKLSLEKWITEDFPPVFLWACEDDKSVPFSNAVRMADALKGAGVLHMLRLYPTGGHGCGLAFRTSARKWTEEMLHYFTAPEDPVK